MIQVQKQNIEEKFYLDALTQECMPHPIRNPRTIIITGITIRPNPILLLNPGEIKIAIFSINLAINGSFPLAESSDIYNTNPRTAPTYAPHILKGLKLFFAISFHKIFNYKYFSFLNNNSKNSNRENLNFASQLFSNEKSDIISVKRKTLWSFPKSATPTSFNLDIKLNLAFCLPTL